MGLLSDGGVHSDITHLYALLELAKKKGLKKVYVHALLDGRDTPPRSALKYFDMLEAEMKKIGAGKVATVSGRYYTMDRDKRWDRVKKGYDAMVSGVGEEAENAKEAVEKAYERGENDEFVLPTVILSDGKPTALVEDKDSFIFFNFRADRARQITRALVDENFKGFNRGKKASLSFVCLAQYDKGIKAPVAYPPEEIKKILSQVLGDNGLKQLRIAETEKYAHVTFFFNGGVEKPYPLEDRILIPSPKVATYDLKPEMSAYDVTDRVIKEIDRDFFDVIIMNYANCDMVGHTGIMKAAVSAVEAVDSCVGRVVEKVLSKSGTVMVAADHGNAERMVDKKTKQAHTAHTSQPVPFCLVSEQMKNSSLRGNGILADIAPTMLAVLKIKKPKEMTGSSLIEGSKE
jgi:2,3-bisphosphoglycerate-independent phosphoglycerate mutase